MEMNIMAKKGNEEYRKKKRFCFDRCLGDLKLKNLGLKSF